MPSSHVRLARFLSASMLWALLLGGCAGAPSGVEVVNDFDLDRYLGTWYEIARLDHPFERGLTDVTATYRPREGGGVEVLNSGFDPEVGERRTATGKAFLVGDPDVGALKVSFFGPFYGGYNVVALDREDYCWSLVAGPTRSYLWILSRTPALAPATLERLTARASELGFAVDDLIWVEQTRADRESDAGGDWATCAAGPR